MTRNVGWPTVVTAMVQAIGPRAAISAMQSITQKSQVTMLESPCISATPKTFTFVSLIG